MKNNSKKNEIFKKELEKSPCLKKKHMKNKNIILEKIKKIKKLS